MKIAVIPNIHAVMNEASGNVTSHAARFIYAIWLLWKTTEWDLFKLFRNRSHTHIQTVNYLRASHIPSKQPHCSNTFHWRARFVWCHLRSRKTHIHRLARPVHHPAEQHEKMLCGSVAINWIDFSVWEQERKLYSYSCKAAAEMWIPFAEQHPRCYCL